MNKRVIAFVGAVVLVGVGIGIGVKVAEPQKQLCRLCREIAELDRQGDFTVAQSRRRDLQESILNLAGFERLMGKPSYPDRPKCENCGSPIR